jgi:hypothetical protein
MESVREYETAAAQGNSLADANLALRLINGGFGDRARELLREAAKKDDVHPNIGTRTAELAERENAETERRKKVVQLAEKKQAFFRAYAEARFSEHEVAQLAGNWTMDGISLEILQTDAQAVGTYTLSNARQQLRMILIGWSLSYTVWAEEVTTPWALPITKQFKQKGSGLGFLQSDNDARLLDTEGVERFWTLRRSTSVPPHRLLDSAEQSS